MARRAGDACRNGKLLPGMIESSSKERSPSEGGLVMDSYKLKGGKWRVGHPACGELKHILVSSKASAFLEGVGTLLEIYPNPRPRTIRAFVCHHMPDAGSVKEAIWGDWAAIGQDMWAAFEAREHEESPKEAATGAKSFSAR